MHYVLSVNYNTECDVSGPHHEKRNLGVTIISICRGTLCPLPTERTDMQAVLMRRWVGSRLRTLVVLVGAGFVWSVCALYSQVIISSGGGGGLNAATTNEQHLGEFW